MANDSDILSRENYAEAIGAALADLPENLKWMLSPHAMSDDHLVIKFPAARGENEVDILIRSYRRSYEDLKARWGWDSKEKRQRLQRDGDKLVADIVFVIGAQCLYQRRIGIDRVIDLKRSCQTAILDALLRSGVNGITRDVDDVFFDAHGRKILDWQ